MLYFKNARIGINGTGIMADSATLDVANDLIPVLSLGKRGMITQTPNGQGTATATFSYISEPGNEPVKGIVDFVKNNQDTAGTNGVVLEVGGISGIFFLDNFTYKIAPNDAAVGNATFVSFQAVSGDLTTTSNLSFNPANESGVGHSYTTVFTKAGNPVAARVFDFAYSFKVNWNPFFILGKKEPVQFSIGSATETFSLTQDIFNNVSFSGEPVVDVTSIDNIKVFALSGLINGTADFIEFPLDGLTRSVSVAAALDDMVKVTLSAEKEYH